MATDKSKRANRKPKNTRRRRSNACAPKPAEVTAKSEPVAIAPPTQLPAQRWPLSQVSATVKAVAGGIALMILAFLTTGTAILKQSGEFLDAFNKTKAIAAENIRAKNARQWLHPLKQ